MKALALSHVHRWVIRDTVKPQSVADHSFRVAVIADAIVLALNTYLDFSETDKLSVTREALYHDLDEVTTGDIPSISKPHSPPTNLIQAIVNLADKVEAHTWIFRYGIRCPETVQYTTDRMSDAIGYLADWIPGVNLQEKLAPVIRRASNYE